MLSGEFMTEVNVP